MDYRILMDPLYRRAIIQGVLGTIVFIAVIFGSAGTFHYWQGWLFLAVFSASTIAFAFMPALGFSGVSNVHVGRLVELDVEDPSQLDAMCERLLTNPLIEDYEVL